MVSDDLCGVVFLGAYLGVPLFAVALAIVWVEWVDARGVDEVPYDERVRRKRIWARAVLTAPLWIWWALFPALAVALLVVLVLGSRAAWRMAFPGRAPTDGPTPSEGAYR